MQQKKDKINTSEKILVTAFECLSTRGYANVTMRNIADEAGVALSQLTYYYKNKEKLFIEVIHMMTNQYLKELEALSKNALNAKDKLACFVDFFRELIHYNPNLLKLFIDFTAQSLWIPSFREQLDILFNAVTDIIERNLSYDFKIVKDSPEYSSECKAKLILGAVFGTSIQIVLTSDKDSAFESLALAKKLLS